MNDIVNPKIVYPFSGPIARGHREHLITKLCENLVDQADLDTLCNFYYEDQFKYFDKEADFVELIDWLVSTETITEEEATELEKNGF